MNFTRPLKYHVFVPLYNIEVAEELIDITIFESYQIIKREDINSKCGLLLFQENHFARQLFQDISERHPDKLIFYPYAKYVLYTEFVIKDDKEYDKKVHEIKQNVCDIVLALRLISEGRCQIYNGYCFAEGCSACVQFEVSSQLLNMECSHRTNKNALVVEELYNLTSDKIEQATNLFKILQTLPKDSYAVPVVYFNKYYDSLLPHERIIQLAIFLESTLLAGQTDELNYRLYLRASAFLGKDVSKILKLFYAARSQIVHNGHIMKNKDGKDIIKRLKKLINSDREDETELLFYFVNDYVEPIIRELFYKSILLMNSGAINNFDDLAQKLDTFIMKQITKESFEVDSIDAQNLDELGV